MEKSQIDDAREALEILEQVEHNLLEVESLLDDASEALQVLEQFDKDKDISLRI